MARLAERAGVFVLKPVRYLLVSGRAMALKAAGASPKATGLLRDEHYRDKARTNSESDGNPAARRCWQLSGAGSNHDESHEESDDREPGAERRPIVEGKTAVVRPRTVAT